MAFDVQSSGWAGAKTPVLSLVRKTAKCALTSVLSCSCRSVRYRSGFWAGALGLLDTSPCNSPAATSAPCGSTYSTCNFDGISAKFAICRSLIIPDTEIPRRAVFSKLWVVLRSPTKEDYTNKKPLQEGLYIRPILCRAQIQAVPTESEAESCVLGQYLHGQSKGRTTRTMPNPRIDLDL